MLLTVQQRDELLAALNENQREFLTNQLVRSRRTAFANAMAKEKGYHIPEHLDPEDIERLLDDWIYTGYIDAGHVTQELRCECGRPLRYQHHVKHQKTGEVKKFGIEHLKEHLNVDASMVAAVKKGFDAIDYELDELLLKIENKWQVDPELLNQEQLPEDVMTHLKLGLPLLTRQINRLQHRILSSNTARMQPIPQVSNINTVSETIDLLNWQDFEKPSYVIDIDIPRVWKEAIQKYITNGVRSARIICELLITELQASSERYITGKPKIYFQVCQYIEQSMDIHSVRIINREDRYYKINGEGK